MRMGERHRKEMKSEGRRHFGWGDLGRTFLVPPPTPGHFRGTQMFTGQGLWVAVFSPCCPRFGIRDPPLLYRKADREEFSQIKATDVIIT